MRLQAVMTAPKTSCARNGVGDFRKIYLRIALSFPRILAGEKLAQGAEEMHSDYFSFAACVCFSRTISAHVGHKLPFRDPFEGGGGSYLGVEILKSKLG